MMEPWGTPEEKERGGGGGGKCRSFIYNTLGTIDKIGVKGGIHLDLALCHHHCLLTRLNSSAECERRGGSHESSYQHM